MYVTSKQPSDGVPVKLRSGAQAGTQLGDVAPVAYAALHVLLVTCTDETLTSRLALRLIFWSLCSAPPITLMSCLPSRRDRCLLWLIETDLTCRSQFDLGRIVDSRFHDRILLLES